MIIKILISVVIGALLLGGLYLIFKCNILSTLTYIILSNIILSIITTTIIYFKHSTD